MHRLRGSSDLPTALHCINTTSLHCRGMPTECDHWDLTVHNTLQSIHIGVQRMVALNKVVRVSNSPRVDSAYAQHTQTRLFRCPSRYEMRALMNQSARDKTNYVQVKM